MAYLDTIKTGAVSTWRTHQVLPSVVGAQAALESGWGTSKLAKPPYNNQFGIKASDDWTGRTVTMPTREYTGAGWVTSNEPFRAYDSAGDSVNDHGASFTSTPWRKENYKAVVGETDYKKACWALQNAPAPYATDPGYAQKLINLIENNNLQAWDREALADNSNTVATQTQQTVVSKMVGADLTDAGKQYVRDLEVTMIGDSLGVGTKPYFESLVPKANYDVLGSRQITHATNSLNGTYILQQMKNAGTLKEYVVVILGTNRGVTEQEVNNFASIAGDNHKVIFVDTASEVAHINTLSVYYQDAAKRLNNVYFANWRLKANSLKPQYYSKDGANGEYIHMTPLGYQKHAEFIAQALYEVATANFTDRVAEATKVEFYNIENFELNEDGLITYDAWRVNADGTSTKYKATKQTDIKGLYSPYGESNIYNPSANQQYGLGNSVNNSNWRETYFEDSEETDGLKLIEKASAELIERQEPEMIYTVNLLEIPVELSIGDTGIFVDHEFNPPLYIRARVLSITTSETNANLNKVTIGNVTELQPQDKSALMAIRAELQETRKDLESSWIGSISTDMTIVSTNGYVLGDRTRETSLVAKVFKGKEDITDQYEVFTWERISEDTAKDTVFNSALAETIQSSVLTVHEKDVIGNQSKFVARAFNATGELISHQEIVIKRVETALWTDTDTAPPYAIDGATWVDESGKHWILKDGEWEERVDQAQLFSVRGEVEGAIQEAEQAKEAAEQAYQDAIDEAERLVTEKDAVWKGKMDDYDAQVARIEADAQSAQDKANQALIDVGISTDLAQTAKDLAQTAKDLAQLAEDSAETALTNAQTAINEAGIAASQAVQAINTADTAKTNAQTALTNAQTALTEAGNAKTTANNLSIRVDDVEAEVELKANQTTVDGLSGTVSNHSTTLSQHANQIASKADSSFVNTIKGTVDTHTTEIAQNATEIASKASAISVNTLTGRVNTAETTITQHAGLIASKASQTEVDTVKGTVSGHASTLSQHATQISARLTSSQVNSLVDGKGLAKVTYVDNQISATAEGFSSELTKVEGKIDGLQVGGRNLIKNSTMATGNGWEAAENLVATSDGKIISITNTISVYPRLFKIIDFEIKDDEIYTLSFEARTDYPRSEAIWLAENTGNRSSLNKQFSYTNEWTRYTTSFRTVHGSNIAGTGLRLQFWVGKKNDTVSKNLFLRNIKLEKGNVATDWTPAPEDTMMENDFTVFKNSYQSTVDSINTELSKTAKITDLNGMVTESVLATKQFVTQGSITTTLSDYSKTTDLNGKVKETVTYVDNKITASAESFGIEMARVEGKIDGLEIGGRNYFSNKKAREFNADNEYTLDNYYNNIGSFTQFTNLTVPMGTFVGQEIVLSFECISPNGATPLMVYNGNANPRYFMNVAGIQSPIDNVWIKQVLKITVIDRGDSSAYSETMSNKIEIYAPNKVGVKIRNVKLEKGNKATDWSPAPEDTMMESDFTVFKNSYQNTVDSINTELSKTAKITDLNGMVTESILATKQFVTQGSITTTLSGYLKTADLNGKVKETVAYQGIKETTDRYTRVIGSTDAESRTKIAQIAMTDSLFQTTVRDSISIGGDNLLSNTETFEPLPPTGTSSLVGAYSRQPDGTLLIGEVGSKGEGTVRFRTNQNMFQGEDILISFEFIVRFSYVEFRARRIYSGGYTAKQRFVGQGTRHKITLIVPGNTTQDDNNLILNVTNQAFILPKTLIIERGNTPSGWSPAVEDKANQSQVTQLAGSWSLRLKSGNDIKTQINASTDSIRLASKLIHLSGTSLIDNATIKSAHIDSLNANKITGNTADFNTIRAGVLTTNAVTSTHISANDALIDKLFATSALIERLTTKTAFISQLKAIDLVADKASFVQAGWQGLNSNVTVDSSKIRLTNSAKDYIEMNGIPELRSQDNVGTAAILGKGRSHYYSGSQARFYIGSNLEGLAQYGVHIAKGQTWGIYRNSDRYGGTPAQYHTVLQGEHWRSITTKYWNDSTSVNVLMQLNGYNVNNYPVLQPGDVLLIKAAVPGNQSGVERVWTMGTSSDGSTRVYSHVYHVFEAGTSLSSDRRIKHDIEETKVKALDHIESLAFKQYRMNRDNRLIELGLIAQDSGILRVRDDETEGIDLQGSIMLALKAIQELQEEIKLLKGA